MGTFPDESLMPRSADNLEPIRGGSIGLNRILGYFVDASLKDRKPQFDAILLSAFTIFRNVASSIPDATVDQMDEGFLKDINLFLEYYDTYCSHVWNKAFGDTKKIPVIVYFPDYHRIPKAIEREFKEGGDQDKLIKSYRRFLFRHGNQEGSARVLENLHCFWMQAGHATYPHVDVARKFREITHHPTLAYATGAPIGLLTSTTVDYHIAARLRGIHLIESYTGKVRPPAEFRYRLDKEGRIPFNSVTHLAFGDKDLIKPLVTGRTRTALLEEAAKDRWISRSEHDIAQRIVNKTDISMNTFRKYNFT